MRLRARHGMSCATLLFAAAACAADGQCDRWPEWQRFRQLYLSDDGRVVDATAEHGITVSEGQAYALTFALIANDPASFERILRWTRDNLAAGDLAHSLPAWKWGRNEDGKWMVLDSNSAADADLWIAYALTQAARLWHNPADAKLAQAVLEQILRDEVAFVPGLGATLLPGPRGFVSQQTWRLNASYSPVQVLRAVGAQSGNPLWAGVIDSSVRVLQGSAPHGFAADWTGYRAAEGFAADAATHGLGSYDAIRVYLWAGMLPDGDAQAATLTHQFEPMAARAAHHPPPESIDSNTLEERGEAPPGFLAALLPLLAHFKLTTTIEDYRKRIEAKALADNLHYYSDALTLFGLGWIAGRYRFDRHGDLRLDWSAPCRAP